MQNTPNYIKSLLMPNTKAPQGRRVWSVDLETVWIPFFTATNTSGDTALPHDALGAPIRLAYAKDGSVKFGRNGRPTTTVARPIRDAVALVRENFVANLKGYSNKVATELKDEYQNQVALCVKAGAPITANDRQKLDEAIQQQLEKVMAEAQAVPQPEAAPETVAV